MVMEEVFEKVLNKIVVPMNDRLSGVKVERSGSLNNVYDVTYYINDRIDYKDGYDIERETKNIFNMLGKNQKESFIISYEKGEGFF